MLQPWPDSVQTIRRIIARNRKKNSAIFFRLFHTILAIQHSSQPSLEDFQGHFTAAQNTTQILCLPNACMNSSNFSLFTKRYFLNWTDMLKHFWLLFDKLSRILSSSTFRTQMTIGQQKKK